MGTQGRHMGSAPGLGVTILHAPRLLKKKIVLSRLGLPSSAGRKAVRLG